METVKDSIKSHLLENETIQCVYNPNSGFVDDSTNYDNILYVTSKRLLYTNESSTNSKTSFLSISNVNSIEFDSNRQRRFSGLIWASASILVVVLSLIWNQPVWTPILCILAIGLSIYFIVEQSMKYHHKTLSIKAGNATIQLYLNEKAVRDSIKLTKLIYSLKLQLMNKTESQESSFALR